MDPLHAHAMSGLEALKPVLTALLLPPVPWLLMILLGLRWLAPRPRLGRAAIVAGVVLIWLSACAGPARWLHQRLGYDLPPLDAAQLASLRADEASGPTAILVLGGGMVASADDPEQGELNRHSLERLRLGVRLARATGWPLAFSGGRGWAQAAFGDSEAEAAQRSATRDFDRPLTWLEGRSRDTAENAELSVALLRGHGVRRVLVVTHASHMPRALALFERAAAVARADMNFVAAPVTHRGAALSPWLEWLPSSEGAELMRIGLREWLGTQVLRLSRGPLSS